MTWTETVGEQSAQILLEGDMIVPDSKPDLQEILRCGGEVNLKEKRIYEDRVSFAGTLEVSVLYRAKNGEQPIYAMTTTLPLEDFIHIEGLEKDMTVSLESQLEHLDCSIINDRKIAVKAVIAVTARATQKRTAEILSNLEGEAVETLTGTLRMERETAELKDHFTVKEELTLPSAKPEIGEILWEEITLTEQDLRPMDGKAMVRGNVKLSILYTDAQGNGLGSFTEKIPFSGYLEGNGIDGRTALDGTLTIAEAKLTPMPDEDGEMRMLGVDVTVGAELRGRETAEQEILLDAYLPQGTLELQRERVTYPVTVAEGKNQFILKERIQLENGETPMLRTEEIWGEVRSVESRTMADAIEAEGVLLADLLYESADDAAPVCIIHRGIPFTQVMELKGVQEGDTAEVKLRLEDLDFQMLSEREGELRATLTMEATVQRAETAEWVTDVMQKEEEPCQPMAGAIIYLVQQGDSLWKIAKRYCTTVAEIAAVNEMENPDLIYPGQKLLIIKMVR